MESGGAVRSDRFAHTPDRAAIDLRTDFISRPTRSMVEAMVRAANAAPGFGLRDDPTVAALERRAAEILGKEDALFCPTCTAANQIAINVQTAPGDRVAADATSHIITSEGGAPGALSGVMMQGIPGHRGEMPMDVLAATLDAGDPIQGRTRLVVIENTHVRSGGTVLSLDYMTRVRKEAAARNIRVHLDGSRLFNAAAALGVMGRPFHRAKRWTINGPNGLSQRSYKPSPLTKLSSSIRPHQSANTSSFVATAWARHRAARLM